MSPTTERFAAIDVGSNSIRCLIAERAEDGQLRVIDDLKDQPRLARGLTSTGVLAAESMERALESLGRMIQAAERRGAARLALVATSAVRDAANGAQFAERVKQELGIPLEVIDGETEARLAFLSSPSAAGGPWWPTSAAAASNSCSRSAAWWTASCPCRSARCG
jgi:exopolyphosphatase/guanosine-5'-triphosphate,3'-diphosphate pyrophosphatase